MNWKQPKVLWPVGIVAALAIAAGGAGVASLISASHENPAILRTRGGQAELKKDFVEAFKCYKEAADQGDAKAQHALGVFFYDGKGVTKDQVEAVRWWQKSADLGFSGAQRALGKCYYNGTGVPEDHAQAVKWWQKAAEQGDDSSQFLLAASYMQGDGVAKDSDQAVKWFQKVADNSESTNNVEAKGYIEAIENIKRITAKYSKPQGSETEVTANSSSIVYSDGGPLEITALELNHGSTYMFADGTIHNRSNSNVGFAQVFLKCFNNSGETVGTWSFDVHGVDAGEVYRFHEMVKGVTSRVKVIEIRYGQ